MGRRRPARARPGARPGLRSRRRLLAALTEPLYRSISVAGRPPVDVCLRTDVGDGVVPWLLEHDWIDEPVMRAFLDFVSPGMRVLDLGAHLGLFGLTAARLGAAVLAVDAVGRQAEQVRLAAARNGFADFTVVEGVLAARGGREVAFVDQQAHSHVAFPYDADRARTAVTVTVDDLLDARGWETVDVVKLDVEGSEVEALRGMARLFARGARPILVVEANGAALRFRGSDPAGLRRALIRRGYRLLAVDHRRPGVLYEPGRVQPECVTDLLALPPGRVVPEHWTVEGALTRTQTVTRLLDQACDDAAPFRHYAATALAGGPAWLARDPLAAPARRALAEDLDAEVRAACAPAPRGGAPSRPAEAADDELVVVARDLALAPERDHLARAPGQPRDRPRPLALRDVSFHLRRGTFTGVLGDDRGLLLAALGARAEPAAGELDVRGRVLLLSRLTDVLEPDLSFAENVQVASAFLGGRAEASRAEALAERLGVKATLDRPLADHSADVALCLALVLVLERDDHELLVLEGAAAPRHDAVRDWAWRRCEALCAQGVTIVQAAATPGSLLGHADRLLYLRAGTLAAAGHPGSVADLAARHALGLPDHSRPRRAPLLTLAS